MAAPKSWGIKRKQAKWAIKPKPGRHTTSGSVALTTLLRDMIGIVTSSREAGKILKSGNVMVDGKPARDGKLAVGFMDVVSLPAIGKHYRVMLNRLGRLSAVEISAEQSKFKLCKVVGKTAVRGGKVQLNLHDSRNMVSTQKASTGDVLKVTLPDQNVLDVLEYKDGNVALVIKGKHSGHVGTIFSITRGTATSPGMASIASKDAKVTAPKEYVFVIGRKEPEVMLAD